MVVEIEVLGRDRRRESRHGLARSAPKSGYHVDGERQRAQAEHDGRNGHRLLQVAADGILLELEPTHEIGAKSNENYNPKGEEHLSVHDVPAIGKVGHGKEL